MYAPRIYKINNFIKVNMASEKEFRKGHSTEFAAHELVDKRTYKIDKGEIPITIFLDLSKAFDTIDHKILLERLLSYGITRPANKLFQS